MSHPKQPGKNLTQRRRGRGGCVDHPVPSAFSAPLRETFLILVLTALAARAADPRPYPPVGVPIDPKVPARWNRYHDHAQATELLKALAAAHQIGRASC